LANIDYNRLVAALEDCTALALQIETDLAALGGMIREGSLRVDEESAEHLLNIKVAQGRLAERLRAERGWCREKSRNRTGDEGAEGRGCGPGLGIGHR
jgi:hypothetical protein